MTVRDQYHDLIHALGKVLPYPDYNSHADKKTKEQWDAVFSELEKVLPQDRGAIERGRLRDEVSWASPRRGETSKRGRVALLAIAILIVASGLWSWHGHELLKARQIGHSDIYATICSKNPGAAERLMPVDENGIPSSCREFEHYFDEAQ